MGVFGEPEGMVGAAEDVVDDNYAVGSILLATREAKPLFDRDDKVTYFRHFLEDRPALHAQLDCLVALHGRERIAEWKAIGDWRELVRRLLVEHYDPAYRRSSHKNFIHLADAASVSVSSAADAAFSDAAGSLLHLAPTPA